MIKSIGIIGGGLIGGSLALSIKANFPNMNIHLVSRRIKHIKEDKNASALTSIYTSIQSLPKNIDIVFVCTPIPSILDIINQVAAHVNENCIITDVASVKESIETELKNYTYKQCIIPAHPMAGKESTGFAHATADLFHNAPYFLIPQKSPRYDIFKTFINKIGCSPIEIDSKTHDSLMASLSHVPYLTAIGLILAAKKQSSDSTLKKTFGPGFRDCTRVAASSPTWGLDICKTNKDAIINHLSSVIDSLQTLKDAINKNDTTTLTDLFESAKHTRNQLNS
jgi:prephenate dehydrogenase